MTSADRPALKFPDNVEPDSHLPAGRDQPRPGYPHLDGPRPGRADEPPKLVAAAREQTGISGLRRPP